MKKGTIVTILLSLMCLILIAVTVVKVDKLQSDFNKQASQTAADSDSGDTEYDHSYESEELTDEDFLKQLSEYAETGEMDYKASNRIAYYKINSDGTGVCLFNLVRGAKFDCFGKLAATQNNGKNWSIINGDLRIREGHRFIDGEINEKDYGFAFINNTLMVFVGSRPAGCTIIQLISNETGEEKELYVDDIISDLNKDLSDVFATVLSQTDDSVMVAWTYRKDGFSTISDDNQSILCIAEYDSNLREINRIYEDREMIDKLPEYDGVG